MPVPPTLSVAALQPRLICRLPAAVALNPVGTLGAVTSGGGSVVVAAGVPLPGAPAPLLPATATLLGATEIRVGSRRGKGGSATVTGDIVLLQDTTNVDATGATGGGLIQVGGSWQGSDASVRKATSTYVGSGVVLDASATGNGDGGTVVAWSDTANSASTTQVYGTLLARGGVDGGNGGRVETSGF